MKKENACKDHDYCFRQMPKENNKILNIIMEKNL